MITLNANGINSPIKRQSAWMNKTKDPSICCLQHIQIHFRSKDTHRRKVKGWKKIFHTKRNQKSWYLCQTKWILKLPTPRDKLVKFKIKDKGKTIKSFKERKADYLQRNKNSHEKQQSSWKVVVESRCQDSWPPEENSIRGQRRGLISQSFCVIKFY